VKVHRLTIVATGPPSSRKLVEHAPVSTRLRRGHHRKPTRGAPAVLRGAHAARLAGIFAWPPIARAAAIPTLLDGAQLYDTQAVQYGTPPRSLVGGTEPSEADGAGVVFYTANFDDAYSTSAASLAPGNASFTQLNPFTALPPPAGMSFCCDQVVRYVPPNVEVPQAGNFFVWASQYRNNANELGNNVERVAVATPAGVAAGQWAYFDVSGALVRHRNAFLDYPDVEVGQHHLYLTFNEFDSSRNSQGATVMRFVLGELGAIAQGKENELPSYQFYNDTNVSTFRVAQDPTPDSTTYFATHKDDSTLTVYEWPESPGGQISENDVDIPTVGKAGLGLPDGQWLGALNGSPGDQRLRAVTATDVLWPHLLVAFEGGSGEGFPQPQIDIADVNTDFTYTGGFSLDHMNYIWSPSQAFGNVQLASNEFGDVAISFWHNGGGVQHAIGAIGPNLSDPAAPLLTSLGPDTTAGANTAGGADFSALRVSYINSNFSSKFPCFSEAQWTGTPEAPVPTWDTFGRSGIAADCPTEGPAVQPPSPPLGGQRTTPTLSLTCSGSVPEGASLSVHGTISPPPYNAAIRLLFAPPSGQGTQFNVYANPQGAYRGAITANARGTWTVQAFFDGDISYAPTKSAPCLVTVTVRPPPSGKPSSISLNCPGSAIARHGTISVYGEITPTRYGAPVTVTYTEPDGHEVAHSTSTIGPGNIFEGTYFDEITPEQTGTWTVQSSWPGDATYAGESSRVCDITVSPPPPP
jgi:hypothetical protein